MTPTPENAQRPLQSRDYLRIPYPLFRDLRTLSDDAALVLLSFLARPEAIRAGGLVSVRPVIVADSLGDEWTPARVMAAVQDLCSAGLAEYDDSTSTLFVPSCYWRADSPDWTIGRIRAACSLPKSLLRDRFLARVLDDARFRNGRNLFAEPRFTELCSDAERAGLVDWSVVDQLRNPLTAASGDAPPHSSADSSVDSSGSSSDHTSGDTVLGLDSESASNRDTDQERIARAAVELLNSLTIPHIFSDPHPLDRRTVDLVRQRLREGHSQADFERVVRSKVREWGRDVRMRRHLRPATLFGVKMGRYAAEPGLRDPSQANSWRRTAEGDGPEEGPGEGLPHPLGRSQEVPQDATTS